MKKRLKKDLIITSEALQKLRRRVDWEQEDKSKRLPPIVWNDSTKAGKKEKQKRKKGKNLKDWEE